MRHLGSVSAVGLAAMLLHVALVALPADAATKSARTAAGHIESAAASEHKAARGGEKDWVIVPAREKDWVIVPAKKDVGGSEMLTGSDRANTYRVKPGDQLEIAIWKEPDMRRDTLVLPDGTISYPLAGHPTVMGLTPKEIEELLGERLTNYFNDPFISVVVKQTSGNQVYVMGQVRNPGVFTITQPVDVMQALSLAGGLSQFADKNKIIVLRRLDTGAQKVIRFAYSSVQRGKKLTSNIILKGGDTVVVPEKGLF